MFLSLPTVSATLAPSRPPSIHTSYSPLEIEKALDRRPEVGVPRDVHGNPFGSDERRLRQQLRPRGFGEGQGRDGTIWIGLSGALGMAQTLKLDVHLHAKKNPHLTPTCSQ